LKSLPGIDRAFAKPPVIRKLAGVKISITPCKEFKPLKDVTEPVMDHMASLAMLGTNMLDYNKQILVTEH
jgi:hypothetical protein